MSLDLCSLVTMGQCQPKPKVTVLFIQLFFSRFLVYCLVCKRPNDLNIYSSKVAITVHIAIPKQTNLKIPWFFQIPRK